MAILLDKAVPVIAAIIGWILGRVNQTSEQVRQERVKLKRLLYNLLELKFWIEKEVNLDRQLNLLLDSFEKELEEFIHLPKEQFQEIRPIILEVIRDQFLLQPKLPLLESNIETVIKELSEVDPILAFELTGRFLITEKIGTIKSYLDKASVDSNQDEKTKTAVVNGLLRPQLMTDLIKQLNEHIIKIAKRIDRNTLKRIHKLDYNSTQEIDESEIRSYLKTFVPNLLSHH